MKAGIQWEGAGRLKERLGMAFRLSGWWLQPSEHTIGEEGYEEENQQPPERANLPAERLHALSLEMPSRRA